MCHEEKNLLPQPELKPQTTEPVTLCAQPQQKLPHAVVGNTDGLDENSDSLVSQSQLGLLCLNVFKVFQYCTATSGMEHTDGTQWNSRIKYHVSKI
jgi:hypothetical protein